MTTDKPFPVERQEFESQSSAGLFYEAIVRSDGMLACNCRGWTMKKAGKPRRCAHTDKLVRGRMTVDDGSYLYIASLAPRIRAYREALARSAEAVRPNAWIPAPSPPTVAPPVLAAPTRRRIVFTDD